MCTGRVLIAVDGGTLQWAQINGSHCKALGMDDFSVARELAPDRLRSSREND
jgi:hypothetical protein